MQAAYARDGFLVFEGFASPDVCALLRARTHDLIAAFDPEENRVAFSAGEQEHASKSYFRESGDKVRFFVEEGAVAVDGTLDRPKARAVNKIGHALHDLDPIFAPFSHDPRLAETAADLGLADPVLAQSMLICKQPEIGGEVDLHQDATFLITDPPSVTGFWIALEAADRENGCLMALPGAHKGPLKRLFHYEGEALIMDIVDDTPWDMGAEVALEVPEGAMVVLHGLLPHRSAPNLSARSRLAYALHCVDRAARWSPDNWLRRAPEMPFRGFEG
jgi:phytanoyl-CoA hydroxylase